MKCTKISKKENSLVSSKKKKEFSINPSLKSLEFKNSVGDMPCKLKPNEFDPSISFINDVSTMSHSMLVDTSQINTSQGLGNDFTKYDKNKKKLKKSNKILGFFKKIFKSKPKKKKKKKGQKVDLQESFMSTVSNKTQASYTKSNVDFSKAEIFSNE